MFSTTFLFLVVLAMSITVETNGIKTNVIVSGAAGKTGSIIFKKLLLSEQFNPLGNNILIIYNYNKNNNKGIVRTVKSAKSLRNKLKLDKLVGEKNIIKSDITDVDELEKTIRESGAEKYIMCTSAVPKIKVIITVN